MQFLDGGYQQSWSPDFEAPHALSCRTASRVCPIRQNEVPLGGSPKGTDERLVAGPPSHSNPRGLVRSRSLHLCFSLYPIPEASGRSAQLHGNVQQIPPSLF